MLTRLLIAALLLAVAIPAALGYGNIVSLAVNRTLLPKLPYDVEKDLTLVSNCVRVFNMLAVNNDLPVRTVAELVDYAKKNPGKLSNGSSGNGTTGHLGGELPSIGPHVKSGRVRGLGVSAPKRAGSWSWCGARRRSGPR